MGQKKKKRLTPKQEGYCHSFVKLRKKSDAYRAHYDCSRMSDKTVNEKASRLHAQDNITARIDELLEPIEKQAEEDLGVTMYTQLQRLNLIASVYVSDYAKFDGENLIFNSFEDLTDEQKYCIESIRINKDGKPEIKFHSKITAIDVMNKMLGFYEKDNNQKAASLNANVQFYIPDNSRDLEED